MNLKANTVKMYLDSPKNELYFNRGVRLASEKSCALTSLGPKAVALKKLNLMPNWAEVGELD